MEAKADQPFGETVADTLAAALERYLINDRSNGILRIQQLAQSLLGARGLGDPSIRDLRYQLLTATAGALCEAERRGYSRTLLLVHEFSSDVTKDEKHAGNAADLDAFLRRLTRGSVSHLGAGQIGGPFVVPGKPLLQGITQLFWTRAHVPVRLRELRARDRDAPAWGADRHRLRRLRWLSGGLFLAGAETGSTRGAPRRQHAGIWTATAATDLAWRLERRAKARCGRSGEGLRQAWAP